MDPSVQGSFNMSIIKDYVSWLIDVGWFGWCNLLLDASLRIRFSNMIVCSLASWCNNQHQTCHTDKYPFVHFDSGGAPLLMSIDCCNGDGGMTQEVISIDALFWWKHILGWNWVKKKILLYKANRILIVWLKIKVDEIESHNHMNHHV